MSRAAKGSAVSRNTLKKQKSSVHTPLHTSRIHPSVHVLYVCTLFMYSMYVLVVDRVQGRQMHRHRQVETAALMLLLPLQIV